MLNAAGIFLSRFLVHTESYKILSQELVALISQYMPPPESQTTIIREKKPLRSDLHPTMKPIKLISRIMTNSSKHDWIVLDPFSGSGTTLITAEKTGRIARCIELDEHYCDVIVKRYAMTTGRRDIKLIRNGEEMPANAVNEIFAGLDEEEADE